METPRAAAASWSCLLPLLLLLLAAACNPATPADPGGGCHLDTDCAAGELCIGGQCQVPEDPCPPLVSCPGGCKDLDRDPQNCGGCGVSCGDGGCVGGACCTAEGAGVCDGACIDLRTDPRHCGTCGVECGAELACAGGGCCPIGLNSCDVGCRDLSLDPGACGSCDTRCMAGAPCVDGVCGACLAGTVEVDCGALRACLPADGPVDRPCRLPVPAGAFEMGHEFDPGRDLPDDYTPPRQVTLTRPYQLDLTEVTQADYSACVDAGACATVDGLDLTRKADLPVAFLTWSDAAAFCAFRGGRLPTEAEWEKAARGTEARLYPWGWDEITCGHGADENCTLELQPVGRYPLGTAPYGHLDLFGNAAEWVADLYDADAYRRGEDVDPAGPATGDDHVYRGPELNKGHHYVFFRWHGDATYFRPTLSLRCAYDVP